MLVLQGISVLDPHVSHSQHMYDADISFDLQGASGTSQPFSVGLILVMGSNSGEPWPASDAKYVMVIAITNYGIIQRPYAEDDCQMKHAHSLLLSFSRPRWFGVGQSPCLQVSDGSRSAGLTLLKDLMT